MDTFFFKYGVGRGVGKVAGGDKLFAAVHYWVTLIAYDFIDGKGGVVGVEGVGLGGAGGCSCCAAHYQL